MKRPPYVRNAARAARRVLVAAATGQKVLVSDKMRLQRVDMCQRCPHFIAQFRQCGECGCFIDVKARLATEKCPKHRWPITNQS